MFVGGQMTRIILLLLLGISLVISLNVHASLLATYYNLSNQHPDMEGSITGWRTGYVESNLSSDMPTLTPYGASEILQWDWWTSQYQVGQGIHYDVDLQSNFVNSWFPGIVNTGLPGDPNHFAVKWTGQFYVAGDKAYTYTMGSDDDSWLFVDKQLVLDLGGVHGITYDNYTISLNQGWHDIDIYFAQRHTSQSGFQLNFFSDLSPAIPEPATVILLGTGLLALVAFRLWN
jgi:fibro-slime domain-containing protein